MLSLQSVIVPKETFEEMQRTSPARIDLSTCTDIAAAEEQAHERIICPDGYKVQLVKVRSTPKRTTHSKKATQTPTNTNTTARTRATATALALVNNAGGGSSTD
jgi:hypothetical protein